MSGFVAIVLATAVCGQDARKGSLGEATTRFQVLGSKHSVDPDRDCKIRQQGESTQIDVPGTLHDLNSDIGKFNAPRVVQDIDGDFVAQVKVTGQFLPGGPPTGPRSLPYNGGGLLVWLDERNFIRIERSAVLRNGKVGTFVLFERRQQGRTDAMNNGTLAPGTAYLRLERRGDWLSAATSANGRDWVGLRQMEISWPSELKVGVAAVNSNGEPMSVAFEEFKIGPASPGPAASTPEDTYRSFLIAIATRDEQALRALVLPAEGFEWLLKGEVAPAEQVQGIRVQVAGTPLVRLKPGDKINLPGNRTITVQDAEVSPDRVVLVPDGAPLPVRFQKVDGKWRIDARPIIAARRAIR